MTGRGKDKMGNGVGEVVKMAFAYSCSPCDRS